MAPLSEKSTNRRTRLSEALKEATANPNSSGDDKENVSQRDEKKHVGDRPFKTP